MGPGKRQEAVANCTKQESGNFPDQEASGDDFRKGFHVFSKWHLGFLGFWAGPWTPHGFLGPSWEPTRPEI